MALIPCPECGREISTLAVACPGCGCPQDTTIESAWMPGAEASRISKDVELLHADNLLRWRNLGRGTSG